MSELVGTGLRFERAGRVIFDGLDVTARSGERLAVVGASGSGKTSLLSLLAGLEAPSAGAVLLDGLPLDPAHRRRCALVLQGHGLVSLLTAAENVEAALRASGTPPREARAVATEVIDAVGLTDFAEHLVEELSGGQQQRVAIARALAMRPDVLLADEPTSDQDAASRAVVLELMRTVSASGAIVVLATHDPEVAEFCTRTFRMHPQDAVVGHRGAHRAE